MSLSSYVNRRSWKLRRFLNDITNKSSEVNICMEDEEINQTHRCALIHGGDSPLGGRCVADLKTNGWWVASIDFAANPLADVNILLLKEETPVTQEANITSSIRSVLGGRKLDFIFCTSDSFANGAVEDDLISVGMEMWVDHMVPPMICAKIASKCLKNNGMLVLSGSLLAMKANPDMIGYSVAKASVVHFTKCLAMPGSGMPGDSLVFCLMPNYLETEKGLHAHVPHGNLTPLQFLSDLVVTWSNRKNLPSNGALCRVVTNNFSSEIIYKD